MVLFKRGQERYENPSPVHNTHICLGIMQKSDDPQNKLVKI